MPCISICLPCLNTASYLPERIQSLRQQSLTEFQVLVLDSYSDDGSWEMLKTWAKEDKRVGLKQGPRGLYSSWNNCLRECRGSWVYIATSDDSMSPDCLEVLYTAAQKNPAAQIITSLPWVTDARGNTIEQPSERRGRWLSGRPFESDNWLQPELELSWGLIVGTPSLSVTQMLIKREVFDKEGYFPEDCGSFGDYLWQMRLHRKSKWFHVGRRLGTWRKHDRQASPQDGRKYSNARAELSLRLHQEGILGNLKVTMDALGYCIGKSDVKIPNTLPERIRLQANYIRSNPRSFSANPYWALFRSRWLGGK
jgi:glycosyltransferase involved in cell wall biosynthesis